jgi:hypothetical protein
MSILSLELLDVTAFQALVQLRQALTEHPGLTVRVMGEDGTIRHNVLRFLEKEGRAAKVVRDGFPWELEIAPGAPPAAPPPQAVQPLVAPVLTSQAGPRPLVFLRSAFTPGDRALGRRLVLDLLRRVEGVPWVGLAHEALELLEDPIGREVLEGLLARGVRVRVSLASLAYSGLDPEPFEALEDAEWQIAAGRGELTLI